MCPRKVEFLCMHSNNTMTTESILNITMKLVNLKFCANFQSFKHINCFSLIHICDQICETCIVHTSNFSTLLTHKIYWEWQIAVKLGRIIELILLYHSWKFHSYLYAIHYGFYVSPNVQNQICELDMFFQIQSHILFMVVLCSKALCWF